MNELYSSYGVRITGQEREDEVERRYSASRCATDRVLRKCVLGPLRGTLEVIKSIDGVIAAIARICGYARRLLVQGGVHGMRL